MKKLNLIISLFILFINFSFAQKLAIKFSVNNYVFADISAPIQIIGCVNYDDIEVTAKNATIRKIEKGKYMLRAKNSGKVYIEIYNKNTKAKQSIPVRVLDSPVPKAVLSVGSIFDNVKLALRRSRGLKTEDTDFMWMNISGMMLYDLTVIHKNKVFRFKDQKGKFSNNIKSLFEILEKSDLVTFYNVQLQTFNGNKKIKLNNLVFEIE